MYLCFLSKIHPKNKIKDTIVIVNFVYYLCPILNLLIIHCENQFLFDKKKVFCFFFVARLN